MWAPTLQTPWEMTTSPHAATRHRARVSRSLPPPSNSAFRRRGRPGSRQGTRRPRAGPSLPLVPSAETASSHRPHVSSRKTASNSQRTPPRAARTALCACAVSRKGRRRRRAPLPLPAAPELLSTWQRRAGGGSGWSGRQVEPEQLLRAGGSRLAAGGGGGKAVDSGGGGKGRGERRAALWRRTVRSSGAVGKH